MLSREARWLVAAVQAVIGVEWLISGADKVLSGTFPQGLASALKDGINGNSNDWYVQLLQSVVLPHSILFGYLIESAEVLVGVVLVTGALLLVGQVRRRGQPQYRLQVNLLGAAVVARCAAWTALVYNDVLEEPLRQAPVNADLILLGLPASPVSRQHMVDAAFRLLRETTLPVLCVPAVGHG